MTPWSGSSPYLDTVKTSDDFHGEDKKAAGSFCKDARWLRLLCGSCGGAFKDIQQTCGKRFHCVYCRKLWMVETKKRFMPVLKHMRECAAQKSVRDAGYRVRMITLTVKNGPDLGERVKHLEHSFKKLKQRAIWKENVQGGLRVLEVTKDKNGNWHPHYHLVVLSKWVGHSDLVDAWEKITKDSKVCDIREVKGDDIAVACELFKYTLKDVNLELADRDMVALLLKGKRLVVTLGSEYKRLEHEAARVAPCECCGKSHWVMIGPCDPHVPPSADDYKRVMVRDMPVVSPCVVAVERKVEITMPMLF